MIVYVQTKQSARNKEIKMAAKPYEKKTWINDVTPLNEDNMNNIEQGIEERIEEDKRINSRIDDTNEYAQELDNVKVDDVHVNQRILEHNNSASAHPYLLGLIDDRYTKAETDEIVDNAIAKLIGKAPEELDTLEELVDWINEHKDEATDLFTSLQATHKAHEEDMASHVTQGLQDKWNEHVVDEVIHITETEHNAYNEHIVDEDIHVTTINKANWDSKAEGIHSHKANEVYVKSETDNDTPLPDYLDAMFAKAEDALKEAKEVIDGEFIKTNKNISDLESKHNEYEDAINYSIENINTHIDNIDNDIEKINDSIGDINTELDGIDNRLNEFEETHYTKTETDKNIEEAVAALVNQSPDALDTLSELAAALGNDADFATNITKLIAEKVPQTRTINSKELSEDIELTAEDVEALPDNIVINGKSLKGFKSVEIPAYNLAVYTTLKHQDKTYGTVSTSSQYQIPAKLHFETEEYIDDLTLALKSAEYKPMRNLDKSGTFLLALTNKDILTGGEQNIFTIDVVKTPTVEELGGVPKTRTINGKELSEDIILTVEDITSDEVEIVEKDHAHDDRYYTEAEADGRFATLNHNHDSVYAALNHGHDDVYSKLNHKHSADDITSGILPTSRGGTGKNTWSVNKILFASSASTITQLAFPTTAGSFLRQGTSGAPYWSTPADVKSAIGAEVGIRLSGANAAVVVLSQGGAEVGRVTVNNVQNSLYADTPTGFNSSSRSDSTWGNRTGSHITEWQTNSGGAIKFRNNNPSDGAISMLLDGTIYVKEGQNEVYHADNKPTPADIGAAPASHSHPEITISSITVTKIS